MVVAATIINAQSIEKQVIASTGGVLSNGTYEISATVGETVVETFISGTLTLTQGFQQANGSQTSVEELVVTANYKLYPNPTLGNAILELESVNSDATISLIMYNTIGKLIYSKTIILQANRITTINLDLTNHSNGVYFVNILDSKSTLVNTIKLIKK